MARIVPEIANRLLFLRQVERFQGFEPLLLEQFAIQMDEAVFPAHCTIVRQGDTSHQFYLLRAGRVRVHAGPHRLAELSRGACFGEIAIAAAQTQTASVITLQECRFLVLGQMQVLDLIQAHPEWERQILAVLYKQMQRTQRLIGCQRKPEHSVLTSSWASS